MDSPAQAAAPVAATERWFTVDAVRGLAVLGILWMNLPVFATLPIFAMNPTLPAGGSEWNSTFWYVSFLFFEGKMRALFSMLFGASVVLLTSRAEGRGAGIEAADVYYRRTLWLMAFGLLHAYFLWDGDILFWYGAMGLLLFPFRKLSGYTLLIAGVLVTSIMVLQGIYQHHQFRTRETDAKEAERLTAAGQPLSDEQTAARKFMAARQRRLRPPTPQEIDKRIKEYQAGYFDIFKRRARQLLATHGNILYQVSVSDVLGFMMIGMGLLKLGVLTGRRSLRFYFLLTLLSYGIGIPLTIYAAQLLIDNNYLRSPELLSLFITYNYDRLFIALGHLGLLMIILKLGLFRYLTAALAAVGQMALTNYIMHSVICTTLFYGYGFGWFGQLELYQLTYVILAIWALQLVLSPLWLHFFRYGPLEWLWRSLTYVRWQPMGRPPV